MTGAQDPFAYLAEIQARLDAGLDGFLAALTEDRRPARAQQRAYDAAGRAERMLCRRLAREGLLGPVAEAEQLAADAYEMRR